MPTRFSGGDWVQRKHDLLTTEIDGEVIAMSIDNGACYGLNRVGTRIWSMLASPISVDAICTALVEQFDVAPDACRRDVVDLLEQLRAEGIVRVGPAR